nr:hypothetical protein [uncultured Microbacterium sp.]
MLTRSLASATIILISVIASPPGQVSAACDAKLAIVGLCGSNDGTSLTVTGTRDQPGTGTEDSDRNNNNSNNNDSSDPRATSPSDLCSPLGSRTGNCVGVQVLPTVGVVPAITISDLAQFAPEAITAGAEPGNVGIAGMPTNFVAVAGAQTRTGAILGLPLSVRFTPAGYDYHYGDGATATVTTAGLSWAQLGQAQFTPTPTSHTYQNRGTYLADVDVRYTAEVDLGTGWFAVDGQLTTDGPTQEIRILEAHTALVAHTCLENPRAPGC